MLQKSFKLKLILSYVFLVAVSFSFIAFFLDRKLEEQSLASIRSSLTEQAHLVSGQVNAELLRKKDTAAFSELINKLGSRINARVTVIGRDGKVLADSRRSYPELMEMENHLSRPEIRAAFEGKTGSQIRYSSTLKIDMLYLAIPLEEDSAVTGVVRLALPLKDVCATLMTIRRSVILSVVFALGLAFLLGSVLAQGVVKPIAKIIGASRRFAHGDFSRRIYLGSADEIGELAETLNKMAQDIEDKIRETEAQNERLKAIFQSMIEGLIVLDLNGRIVSVNPAAERIFSIKKEDVEGKLLLEAVRNNVLAEIMQQVLQSGEF
ncbi:MAG: PAS domain-containing protein, partial [Candidatus Omnitrophica bacterium]|nr:PAS domain-containing protein [Candidatus Omnitrophota bacterium]